ncbi:MAG: hypothetical protein V1820_01020 [archaeon]
MADVPPATVEDYLGKTHLFLDGKGLEIYLKLEDEFPDIAKDEAISKEELVGKVVGRAVHLLAGREKNSPMPEQVVLVADEGEYRNNSVPYLTCPDKLSGPVSEFMLAMGCLGNNRSPPSEGAPFSKENEQRVYYVIHYAAELEAAFFGLVGAFKLGAGLIRHDPEAIREGMGYLVCAVPGVAIAFVGSEAYKTDLAETAAAKHIYESLKAPRELAVESA